MTPTSSEPPDETETNRPHFCRQCGRALPQVGSFCTACGAAVGPSPQRLPQPLPGTVSGPSTAAVPTTMTPVRRSRRGPVIAAFVVLALLAGGGVIALAMRGSGQPISASTTTSSSSPAAERSPSSSPASSPAASVAAVTTTVTASPPPTTPGPQSLADLYKNVNSGVVRIETTTCTGGGIGTGFLVAPNLVATVAHVVNGAAVLKLTIGDSGSGGTTSGVVIGLDPQSDVALVKTNRPLTGHVFNLADHIPAVGQEIGAIGFPEGEPMTLTRGIVSGLDRTIPIDGLDRSGLIQTDVAINPGNSGGPMLATDGQVYGLIDAKRTNASGLGYAVSPTTASARVRSWQGRTTSVVSAGCDHPVAPEPGRGLDPTVPPGSDPRTVAVAGALKNYFDAINAADYRMAWLGLSPRIRGASPDSLAKGDATSYDALIVIHSVTSAPTGAVLAYVSFTSVQAPEKGPDGDSCDNWDLDYTMIPSSGTWLIDQVKGHNGGPTHAAC